SDSRTVIRVSPSSTVMYDEPTPSQWWRVQYTRRPCWAARSAPSHVCSRAYPISSRIWRSRCQRASARASLVAIVASLIWASPRYPRANARRPSASPQIDASQQLQVLHGDQSEEHTSELQSREKLV